MISSKASKRLIVEDDVTSLVDTGLKVFFHLLSYNHVFYPVICSWDINLRA